MLKKMAGGFMTRQDEIALKAVRASTLKSINWAKKNKNSESGK